MRESGSDQRQEMRARIDALQAKVNSVVLGKRPQVELAVVTLLAGGHLMLEDLPGVGKTLLATALARSIDTSYRRIQFTNDTIPADILGVMVYSRRDEQFTFMPGPIFAGVVLADEINRTSPKTQSALLEAMSEHRVSIENRAFPLPDPFMVIATQNPVEHHGAFPLPESQLDRFLLRTEIGYPDFDAEREILERNLGPDSVTALSPAITGDEIRRLKASVQQVRIDRSVYDYLLTLARRTRDDRRFALGVSTRGTLMLKQAVQALAFVRGRDFALPDDVQELVVPVWAHRVLPRRHGVEGMPAAGAAAELLRDLVGQIPVPV